jgi:hypothetical protein
VQNSPMNFVDPSGFEGEQNRSGTPSEGGSTSQSSSGGSSDTNSRSMDSGGGPSSAQSPGGAYSSGNGYGYNYFTDAALLQVTTQGYGPPAVYAHYPGVTPGQNMCMAATPTASNQTGGDTGNSSPQSSGTAQSSAGPGSDMASHSSRSGDGRGQGAAGSANGQENRQGRQGASGNDSPPPYMPEMSAREKLVYFLILRSVGPALAVAAVLSGGGPRISAPLNPSETPVYRGGTSMTVKPGEIKTSSVGLVVPSRGVSVSTNPASVARFGGANQIKSMPEGLKIIQRGANQEHFEIVPSYPMTSERYQQLLNRIEFH